MGEVHGPAWVAMPEDSIRQVIMVTGDHIKILYLI